MAPPVASAEPTQARAGESWLWDIAYADYPRTEGWVLSYELRGEFRITLPAALTSANGDGWHVIVPASTTTDFPSSNYKFLAVLTGSGTYAGRVGTIELDDVFILPNLITAAAGDLVSFAAQALAYINKTILERLKENGPSFYAVDGTSAKHDEMKDLLAAQIRFQAKVNQERAPQQFGRQINHRMKRASA